MKIRLLTRPINKIKQVILDFIHHNHMALLHKAFEGKVFLSC